MTALEPAERLGRELRRLRVRRGLSQRGMVRALGLTAHSNLVEYELGRRIPPGDIISGYEEMFGAEAAGLRAAWSAALADRAGLNRPEAGGAGSDRPEAGRAGSDRPEVGRAGSDRPAADPVERVTPRMLPAGVVDFTGRAGELARLAELAVPDPAGVVIAAIVGTAGVGKTALVVRFAHAASDRFPDGQLYVNLRGYAPGPPRPAADALAALLSALDVPAERIPPEAERAAALYRGALAGRRMLVVLDNAHRADQVRPLLPGAPGCLVLVTSRDRLGGLVAHDGARRLRLDVLTPAESTDLLARIIGAERIAAEPAAAGELGRVCAHLPLALRIAAANLAARPDLALGDYVDRLRAENPLALAADPDEEGAVRAAFESSYRRLSVDGQRLFRRLGLAPGPDVTVAAAARLVESAEPAAARVLDQLTAAHLLDQPADGRFTCHDLLRRYAAERVHLDDAEPARQAATTRFYDWYEAQVASAAEQLYPGMLRLPAPAPRPPGPLSTPADALAWLDAERANLTAAVTHGPAPFAWRLADLLRGYFLLRMPTVDWQVVAGTARDAATAHDDLAGVACAELSLSNLNLYLSRYPQAVAHGTRALELARRTGWTRAEAGILDNLGTVHWQAGQLTDAATHYQQALAINQRFGWQPGLANNLSNLGLVHRESGRLRAAVEHFTRALELDRAADTRHGQETTLANLGEALHTLSELDEATGYLTEALTLCRELGNRPCEANALHTLAAIDLDSGRHDEAHARAVAAVALAHDTGETRVESDARAILGSVHLRRGHRAAAAEQYRRALDLARGGGSRTPEAAALIGLATTEPDRRQALDLAHEALEVAQKYGYRVLEARALATLADLTRAAGQPDEAAGYASRAADLRRETGYRAAGARP